MTIAMRPHEEVAGFCARDGSVWPCAAATVAPPEHTWIKHDMPPINGMPIVRQHRAGNACDICDGAKP